MNDDNVARLQLILRKSLQVRFCEAAVACHDNVVGQPGEPVRSSSEHSGDPFDDGGCRDRRTREIRHPQQALSPVGPR